MRFQDVWDGFKRDRLAAISLVILAIFVVIGLIGDRLAPYDPDEIIRSEGQAQVLVPPSAAHPFGTTDLARDVLSQTLVGARPVMVVGFWAALLPTGIGLLLGLLAGLKGGALDTLTSRAVEIAYSLPFEPVAIALISIISPSRWTIVLAITLLYWRRPTRVVRNQVLTMRNSGFVKASRVAGGRTSWIILKHLGPLTLPLAFVYIPVAFGNAVLAEASISFLGFGDPNSSSWGTILRKAFDGGAVDIAWWWIFFPGLLVTAVTSAVFFLTRPFEEILNPRLRSA
jgi:peptide/nickel transport system permease protein